MHKAINIIKEHFLLFLVITLASVLRFYKITENPPSLNWDEVSIGYNAYSVLTTGADEWGKFFPIIFRAYGDYKLPGYIYLTALSELFFGLTPFAVRLPSVLAGIGTVILTYFFVLELLYSHKLKINSPKLIAAIASLLVAVEPWSLFLSRIALEANLALFFFVAGIYYFILWVRSGSKSGILLSSVLFGLTVWTYNSYRIFTPSMMIFLGVLYKSELIKRLKISRTFTISLLLVITLLFLPMFYQLMSNVGSARYAWVQILDEGAIQRINEARGIGGSRLVHNKVTYLAFDFTKNYLSHFLPGYLFFNGGTNYQFNVPGHGIMYMLNTPFFYLAVFLLGAYIFKSTKIINEKKIMIVIFTWLLLAPVPSSLTREAPQVLRSITFLPLPMILTTAGLTVFMFKFRSPFRSLLAGGYLILLIFQIWSYLKIYDGQYRDNYSQAWQFGYEEAYEYVNDNYYKYDKIIITKKYGEPHEFLLFYSAWDPQRYQSDKNLNRFYQTNWYWVDGFDKFYFVNDWQIKDKMADNQFITESKMNIDCENIRCLLITSPENHLGNWKKVQVVSFLDGKPAFELYEN
jgi:4-amino-4-deoxy-L-arabinose transferase-like glycosyltransferase